MHPWLGDSALSSNPISIGDMIVSSQFHFLIVGGLYLVTALWENDQERVTVHTKHRQDGRCAFITGEGEGLNFF